MKDMQLVLIKRFGISIALALLLGGAFVLSRSANTFNPEAERLFPTTAYAAGRFWVLDVAATPEARALGLGGRESYPAGRGMLFLYSTAKRHSFWMKDMQFDLDVIFLRAGRIIYIERAFKPNDTRIVTPPAPVDQVLEVNAGEADGLSSGDYLWYWRSAI